MHLSIHPNGSAFHSAGYAGQCSVVHTQTSPVASAHLIRLSELSPSRQGGWLHKKSHPKVAFLRVMLRLVQGRFFAILVDIQSDGRILQLAVWLKGDGGRNALEVRLDQLGHINLGVG